MVLFGDNTLVSGTIMSYIFTLGDETSGLVTMGGGDEKISARFRMVANLVNALNVGLPASSDGHKVEGGSFSNVTRSVAVC